MHNAPTNHGTTTNRKGSHPVSAKELDCVVREGESIETRVLRRPEFVLAEDLAGLTVDHHLHFPITRLHEPQ